MPVLSEVPQIFPNGLFDQPRNGLLGRKWWVLHTLPRQEKCLARQLAVENIPFYLPLISRRLRVRQRTQTSILPLFSSYVFLLAEPDERVKALATKRIVRPIPVFDQDVLWRDLGQVYRLISCGAAITPEERLAPGA